MQHLCRVFGVHHSSYRASRRIKQLGLVSTQPPSHAYKKADQPHLDIPNLLDRKFDVEEPRQSATDYMLGYYSSLRPHRHNDGLPPNLAEKNY